MLERVEERFGLKPERLIGDTAYGTAPMLGWLVEQKQIEPHVPVWDKSERYDGTLSRGDFTFDAKARPLRMPGWQTLDQHGSNDERRYAAIPGEQV
jgi:hypothetical protein